MASVVAAEAPQLAAPAPAPMPTYAGQILQQANINERLQLANFLSQQTQAVAQLEEQVEKNEAQQIQAGAVPANAPLPSVASNPQVQALLQQQAVQLQAFQQNQQQQRAAAEATAQQAQQVQSGVHDLQVVDQMNHWKGWPYHSWATMESEGQASINGQQFQEALQQAYAPMNQDQRLVTNFELAAESEAAAGKTASDVPSSDLTSNTPNV